MKELELTENKIKSLFSLIESANSFEECREFFSELEKIQTDLAVLVFKERVEVSTKLRKFVHDFDRLDDIDLRQNMFAKIQKGEYEF